jgi:hypothetical protein
MNVRNLWTLGLSSMIASSAWAFPPGAAGAPATAPAADAGQTSTSALPANHPALPAGHPPLSHAPPATQPTAANAVAPASLGSIAVRATQGTQGGPAVAGGSAVSLDLYHKGQVIHKATGTLDNAGVVIFEQIPMTLECQPMVKLTYDGVEYEQLGQVMDSTRPNQGIDVKVFETTDVEPAWQVQMRHVLVDPSPEGLKVTEMVVVQNPADRAWIGKPRTDGKRSTIALPIPDGATNIEFGDGLHGCCVKTEDGKLVNTMALVPGSTTISFGYVVPATSSQAKIAVTAPTSVKHMMLFVSDTGTPVTVAGLDDAGVRNMGEGKARMFKGTDLKAGHQSILTVAVPQAAVASSTAATSAPKVIAGVGVGAIVVVGAGLVLFKTPKKAK